MSSQVEVEELQREVCTISDRVRDEFGKLSRDQLNWKPAADKWSVAQCLDHLITTNATYLPIFDSVATGTKKQTFVQKLPVLPNIWGKLLIKSFDPKTTRKLKAPAKFQPSSSELSASIVDDFVNNQNRMLDSMEKTKEMDIERIIISSPAAAVVTYSVLDAFRIVVVHEQRHVQQAKRVTEEQNFPA